MWRRNGPLGPSGGTSRTARVKLVRWGLLVVALVLALVPVSAAPSGTTVPTLVGFTDDAPKYKDWKLFDDMNDLGVQENRWNVPWDPSQPTSIYDQGFIDASLPVAQAHNIEILFSIAPLHAADIGSSDASQTAFCNYMKLVAQRYYPRVMQYIVANEPNRQRFWQPQWSGSTDIAAIDYEHTLAKCYDALKSVSPNITVIGLALGANGNDNPQAADHPSHSPVRFIHDVAAAYKESGRGTPIMDLFAYHPYPAIQDTDPPEKGYKNWPNAGVPNLDRLKQAIWDGFHATNQPIFPDEPGGLITDTASPPKPLPHLFSVAPTTAPPTLKFKIDEIGWQTIISDSKKNLYHGTENITPIDPAVQADDYWKMLRYYFCDSLVKEVLILHIIDESDLGTWQSGVEWVDHDHKPSYDRVKNAISDTLRICRQEQVLWKHTEGVINAAATWKPTSSTSFSITATEDYSYSASVTDARTKQVLKSTSGKGKAYYNVGVDLRSNLRKGVKYTYKVTLTADMNPERTTTLTQTFVK